EARAAAASARAWRVRAATLRERVLTAGWVLRPACGDAAATDEPALEMLDVDAEESGSSAAELATASVAPLLEAPFAPLPVVGGSEDSCVFSFLPPVFPFLPPLFSFLPSVFSFLWRADASLLPAATCSPGAPASCVLFAALQRRARNPPAFAWLRRSGFAADASGCASAGADPSLAEGATVQHPSALARPSFSLGAPAAVEVEAAGGTALPGPALAGAAAIGPSAIRQQPKANAFSRRQRT